MEPAWNGADRVDPLGGMRAALSGTLLGADQCGSAVLAVHRQAVHAILPETAQIKKDGLCRLFLHIIRVESGLHNYHQSITIKTVCRP